MAMTPAEKQKYQREWARKRRLTDPEFVERQRRAGQRYTEKNREALLVTARDWKARNQSRVKEARAAYYRINKGRELEQNRTWLSVHPEYSMSKSASNKAYRKRNALVIKAKHSLPLYKSNRNRRERERYSTDPGYAIEKRLRASFNQALRLGKACKKASVLSLLGCSIPELILHLEAQFKPGMSWENRSEWHIDHKRPCASFDLTDIDQQRACFHFTNLQPLWGAENQSKGARF